MFFLIMYSVTGISLYFEANRISVMIYLLTSCAILGKVLKM